MNKASHDYLNDMAKFVGIVVLAIIALLAVGAVLYGLLGYIDDRSGNPHRIIAAVLVMLIPVWYWLGHREGKAHSDGVDRGIQVKVGAQQRQPAPAKIIPQQPAPSGQAPAWQSILPPAVEIPIQHSREDDVLIL